MAKKIYELPKEGRDFLTINIKNNFSISSKVVPRVSLQDLILKFLIINQRDKSIKMLADETNLYSIEDGEKWLSKIFHMEEKNWFFLFDFLPKKDANKKKNKSAIISLLLASLNEVFVGKVLVSQNKHYDKIISKFIKKPLIEQKN